MLTVSLFVSAGLVGLSASVDCVFICVRRTGWLECEC